MNFNQIKTTAKGMGIDTRGMRKLDVVRAIQRAEHNIECYGTQRVDSCNEDSCVWRPDCLSLNQTRPGSRR
jgi:hypothetical protein